MVFLTGQWRAVAKFMPKQLIGLRNESSRLSKNFQQVRCMRAYPQYNIYGESAHLSLKPIMPEFRPAGQDGVALQNSGRMLLGFTPNAPGFNGGFIWIMG